MRLYEEHPRLDPRTRRRRGTVLLVGLLFYSAATWATWRWGLERATSAFASREPDFHTRLPSTEDLTRRWAIGPGIFLFQWRAADGNSYAGHSLILWVPGVGVEVNDEVTRGTMSTQIF